MKGRGAGRAGGIFAEQVVPKQHSSLGLETLRITLIQIQVHSPPHPRNPLLLLPTPPPSQIHSYFSSFALMIPETRVLVPVPALSLSSLTFSAATKPNTVPWGLSRFRAFGHGVPSAWKAAQLSLGEPPSPSPACVLSFSPQHPFPRNPAPFSI